MKPADVTETLKPCPFCGNDGSGPIEDALNISYAELEWRDPTWSVQCDKCTATMGYSDSEDEAITAWNTRATPVVKQSLTADVTEADREAVAAYYVENGFIASQRNLEAHFAAHRIAAFEAGRVAGLEEAAEWFANRFSDAVQADCENGVRSLNERAAAAYLKDAPDTLAAISEGPDAIRALKEKNDG